MVSYSCRKVSAPSQPATGLPASQADFLIKAAESVSLPLGGGGKARLHAQQMDGRSLATYSGAFPNAMQPLCKAA